MLAAAALIFVLTIYAVLLHGTIANQRVRIEALEAKLAAK